MTQPISRHEFQSSWLSFIVANITGALRTLLQEKHLYQSVTVALDKVPSDSDTILQGAIQGPWFPQDLAHQAHQAGAPPVVTGTTVFPGYVAGRFTFRPPDVKLFCGGKCARIEAFNSVSAEEFLGRDELFGKPREYRDGQGTHQVFVLSYECQSCKGVPEVFLVRRVATKLTVVGRTPIEHVEVPNELPKDQRPFFRSAVVAHNSGQTLAGLFLLRTFIEQFARATTGNTDAKADVLMDVYMSKLPDDFNDRFPSMRQLYGDLSVDLHSAVGSAELFDAAREKLTEHFKARALFKL